MLKAQLRHTIRQRSAEHDDAERADLSRRIVDAIRSDDDYQRAATVMLYHPLRDEVDLTPLLDDIGRKTIVLPRVTGHDTMEARLYTGSDSLQAGAFGIMEPTGAVLDRLDDIELVVVPGMAFDTQGHRLGRGRGYYDRFLTRIPHAQRIGVCFNWQIFDDIPTCPTDIAMHRVIWK